MYISVILTKSWAANEVVHKSEACNVYALSVLDSPSIS
jgi:hypothetical protein